MISTSVIIMLMFGAAVCMPETAGDHEHQDVHDNLALEKRSPHYNFGLGKRAYSYVSEYKRLPVYNFGLGKRSRPYSFGLGKRSVEDDQSDEEFPMDIDQPTLTDIFEQYDEMPVYDAKRARPYSFGLGKRLSENTDDVDEKRTRMYDFGLGKRPQLYSFGLGKRARNYNFGLGKRYSGKFNFGLGKRERDLHRFSFGLGKRSADSVDDADNYMDV
ncbi:helicostatins [Danaus plexippus]|uniref:Helicostatin prohormone n=1 Tax=Danaus plexippus plexippus TaxID=278856 RepID=A0A212EJM5_DANPL|nr:helicostatins [Danaus plexippus]OWR41689.1 helicostatin prohormone precursor [Danaus plexippus plexippus]